MKKYKRYFFKEDRMGDMGMYKWSKMMEDHERKGHQMIKSTYTGNVEKDLALMNRRVAFWERHNRVPTERDLVRLESEEET